MKIFDLKPWSIKLNRKPDPPPAPGWPQQWHGYYLPPAHDFYTYGQLERFALLSLFQRYAGQHVTLFELGAGRADICMALAGCCKYGLISDPPASYRALAIEAEPTHFEWCRMNVELQNLNVVLVHGAVCEEVGERFFRIDPDPISSFGQCICGGGEGSIRVSAYTIDFLRREHDFPHINVIHMDVQGAEANCVRGAKKSIAEEAIDHFIIETHNVRWEVELRELLSPNFDCLVNLSRDTTVEIPGLDKPCIGKGGGVQVWQRKGL